MLLVRGKFYFFVSLVVTACIIVHGPGRARVYSRGKGVPGPGGGSAPGGSAWSSQGVPGRGGAWSRGGLVETPGRLLLRAVCILLECILVSLVVIAGIVVDKMSYIIYFVTNLFLSH